MSNRHDMWRPQHLPPTWTQSSNSEGWGGPGRHALERLPETKEHATSGAAKGFHVATHTTRVPCIDKKRMGRKEEGRCPESAWSWSKNGNKLGACPAWDYDRGCWDEDGSPVQWVNKTLHGAPAMLANRNAYLLEVASGHRPQKGFTPGVEPTGTLRMVDVDRLTTEEREGLARKFTPRNALQRTPREIHKLRQTLRAAQQLPPLPEYEPNLDWVEDLSLPTPHEAVGYTVKWAEGDES